MGATVSKIGKIKERVEPVWARCYSHLLPAPDLSTLDCTLLLGNQKTGSTAVAHLLASYGCLSFTSDIPSVWSPDRLKKSAEMKRFIKRHHYYFRRAVVKDNSLTFASDTLIEALPSSRFIYVSRHPVQNIRSILDRLNLPGSPQPLSGLAIPRGWQSILTNEGLHLKAEDHITALAKRWTLATKLFLRFRSTFTLLRYEDFLADKQAAISRLADELGIPPCGDITPLLDVPFQPRGAHRDMPPAEFFDAEAINIIKSICGNEMEALDYLSLTKML